MGRLKPLRTFGDLIEHVREMIEPIRGIRELAVYDVALRIGYKLNLAPDVVYLHAGAAEGARALGIHGPSVHPKALPSAFYRLTPAEIENCLCIYKRELRGEQRRSSRSACSGYQPARAGLCRGATFREFLLFRGAREISPG
jgi:hypothetical protein